MKQDQKKKSKPTSNKSEGAGKETLGQDYWDRVANDAAAGYESKDDENSILNIDQIPGDNERGDKDPE